MKHRARRLHGQEWLCHRHLVAQEGGLPHQRARRFDLRLHIRKHKLNGLKFGDRFAEGAPLLGVTHRRIERALREAHGLGGDAHASAVQRFERDLQPLPFLAEAIFRGHLAIGENDFRRARRAQAHFIFVTAHAKAGEAGFDEKRGDSLCWHPPRRRIRDVFAKTR